LFTSKVYLNRYIFINLAGEKDYYYPFTEKNDSPRGGGFHAITLVGWDDNYPRTKFTYLPPGNGAFLAKNSWGSDRGYGGYFWISYYDTFLGREGSVGTPLTLSILYNPNSAFNASPLSTYDYIYQYDPLGWTSSTYGGTYPAETAWY